MEKLSLKNLRLISKNSSLVLIFIFSFNALFSFYCKNIGIGLISIFFLVVQVIDYLQVLDDEKISELEEKYIDKDIPTERDISMMIEKMGERYEESDANYRRLIAFIIFLKVLVFSIPIVMYFR